MITESVAAAAIVAHALFTLFVLWTLENRMSKASDTIAALTEAKADILARITALEAKIADAPAGEVVTADEQAQLDQLATEFKALGLSAQAPTG